MTILSLESRVAYRLLKPNEVLAKVTCNSIKYNDLPRRHFLNKTPLQAASNLASKLDILDVLMWVLLCGI